jgi:putative two-component system response regulator
MPHHLKTLLLVDDEPTNLQAMKQILQNDYRLLFAMNAVNAIEICKEQVPDMILLDIMLPDMTGYEMCIILKQNSRTAKIPVIFVTAMSEFIDEAYGFEVGAIDYITKPINSAIVRARVSTHLSLVHVEELQESRLQIIQRLGRAAEFRDNETGLHVIRMSHYTRLLALAAGFSAEAAEEILNAAPMHDVGKIGIPDNILLKPGPLDDREWDIMRRHPAIGAAIIGSHDSRLIQMACTIALTHHEKWDGTGYPRHLKGEDIPLVGRIVAVADVFDALTTVRPYKKAWTVEEAISYLQKEAGKHFDPNLIPLFLQILPAVLDVKERWGEDKTTISSQEEPTKKRDLKTLLDQSHAELESFAYIVSHDLQEPLRGINNYTQILQDSAKNKLDEQELRWLHKVTRLTERMSNQIGALLQYSRASQQPLVVETVNLNDLIASVLDVLAPLIVETNSTITIPRLLPIIECDPLRTAYIFNSLLTNAIKFNKSAGNVQVEIGYLNDESPTFFVNDNGIGIPEKFFDVIFNIFRRLHGRDEYDGSIGAGLTISRKHIERQGGTIWLKSTLDTGTTFYFTLNPEQEEVDKAQRS